jgi:hypothetical protein
VDVLGIHLVAERAEGRRRRVSTLLASRVPEDDETQEQT